MRPVSTSGSPVHSARAASAMASASGASSAVSASGTVAVGVSVALTEAAIGAGPWLLGGRFSMADAILGGTPNHGVWAIKGFREGTSGKFVGVGIEIGMEDGVVKVVSPIEGSPAFRAGIKAGDLITRIDETAVKGLTMDQAVKRMRGEPNTKVQLTIFRKAESRSFPVTIVREEIRVQSVRAKMVEPGYAWLRVSQFQDRTVDDFARKLDEVFKADPQLKGLVLDLRNDPGGLLDGAIAISAAIAEPV